MAGIKRRYDVYRVIEAGNEYGSQKTRTFAGSTYAVSEAKACANVEYRLHGKALYGGEDFRGLGGESYMSIYYEAEPHRYT